MKNKTATCEKCKTRQPNCFRGADGKWRCQSCLGKLWLALTGEKPKPFGMTARFAPVKGRN